jgi:3-oxoacyl-[acyl-carrier-protein] synthase II
VSAGPSIRVVVSGAGVVSPLGNDVATFGRRMLAGESGVRGLRGWLLPEDFPVPYGGAVCRETLPALPPLLFDHDPHHHDPHPPHPSYPPHQPPGPRAPDSHRFAAAATAEALAGLPPGLPVDGLVYGTAEGLNYELVEASFTPAGALRDAAWSGDEGSCEGSLTAIARLLAARGHGTLPPAARIAVASACASGNQAIGLALQRIRLGRWRRAVVGGVDARLLPANLMSFHLLSALITEDCPPERASRPFSSDRRGFVRSEGAATLLLESLPEAERRGAEILGEVRGYAHTTDAFHATEGREDCQPVVQAMAMAIADAGLTPDDVDLVSAHGTSTPLNDRLETKALKLLFGAAAYGKPVTALKSQLGHATVAAGAIEAVSCLVMLREQVIAPTLNYREDEIDPHCDLDYVPNRARPAAALRTVLSNSLGFGGHNTCVVIAGTGAP